MKNSTLHQENYSIYPGEYVPFLNESEVKEVLSRKNKNDIIEPAANITEHPDCYKIEVAIPGVKRAELFIYAKGNILAVCAIHKQKKINPEDLQLHEFDHKWFHRNILLPENADSSFISAKYNSGIVKLYIPKASYPVKNEYTRISVY